MSKFLFDDKAWEDYLYWQSQDKKTLKRINNLLKDIERNGNNGIRIIQCKDHYFDK